MIKKPTEKTLKELKFTRSRIFNFTFIIELLAKTSLSKHKSHKYASIQMVCAEGPSSISTCPNFSFTDAHNIWLYKLG